MVFTVHTCALLGLEPHAAACEVDLAKQLPAFSLVGLPSSLTQESRERVRSAVTNSGFDWPARKVTINLLPANLPKWGSHFELAMALGVLGATAENAAALNVLAVGELSLSGAVRACGWLPAIAPWLARLAAETKAASGEPLVLVAHPRDLEQAVRRCPELSKVAELCDARSLQEGFGKLAEILERIGTRGGGQPVDLLGLEPEKLLPGLNPGSLETLASVRREPVATVAALAAVAGGHHVLFAGPQGMGKSMLVRAICEALPALEPEMQAEREALLRSFGQRAGDSISNVKPVVCLQTSITRAALEGALLDSGQVLPGELTRAHLGVLVADELLEYRRDVLEALRQPLDDGLVRLQRAKFRTALPARVQLLASTNLCPCGAFGGTQCECKENEARAYQRRLSGPVCDRFDLVVVVGRRTAKLPPVKIPLDLAPLVARLSDPASWGQRLAEATVRLKAKTPAFGDQTPGELWSQVSTDASDRGRLKMARVSRTLAALDGELRNASHLRLACLMREDLIFRTASQIKSNPLANSTIYNPINTAS